MPQVTEDEKTTLLEAINKVRVWLDEKEAAQALISPHETPIFDSSDVIPQVNICVHSLSQTDANILNADETGRWDL